MLCPVIICWMSKISFFLSCLTKSDPIGAGKLKNAAAPCTSDVRHQIGARKLEKYAAALCVHAIVVGKLSAASSVSRQTW